MGSTSTDTGTSAPSLPPAPPQALLKELVVQQDGRLKAVVDLFEARSSGGQQSKPDSAFLGKILGLIDSQGHALHAHLFAADALDPPGLTRPQAQHALTGQASKSSRAAPRHHKPTPARVTLIPNRRTTTDRLPLFRGPPAGTTQRYEGPRVLRSRLRRGQRPPRRTHTR